MTSTSTPRRWSASLALHGLKALMVVGVSFMVWASTSYLESMDDHPFFLEKLPLAHPRLWLMALYVHVPSALFALPACLVLLMRSTSRRLPRLHRWLGRLTGALVLVAVVPSGMYLALFAQGGLLTTLGFWLSGAVTFAALVQSVRSARARRLKDHRRFSTHVAAQLSVAVFSRLMLIGAETAGFYSTWVYVAALWIPLVGGALVAELVTGGLSREKKGLLHEELPRVPYVHAGR